MPGFAIIGAADMRTVFTCSGTSVMTCYAACSDTAVIEDRTSPTIGVMAVIAGVTTLDMVCGLANGGCTVMTAGASTADLGVIDTSCRGPANR